MKSEAVPSPRKHGDIPLKVVGGLAASCASEASAVSDVKEIRECLREYAIRGSGYLYDERRTASTEPGIDVLIVESDVKILLSRFSRFRKSKDVVRLAEEELKADRVHGFYHYVGEAFVHEGMLDAAISAFKKSIALDPENARWSCHNLSMAYKWSGKSNSAVLSALAAIVLDERIEVLYLNLIELLREEGLQQLALDVLEICTSRLKENAELERLRDSLDSIESSERTEAGTSHEAARTIRDVAERFCELVYPGRVQSDRRLGVADLVIRYTDSHLVEWRENRRSIERLFDSKFYTAQLPSSRQDAPTDSLVHYCLVGCLDDYNPHPLFDTAYYCGQNSQSIPAGIVPLMDYVLTKGRERSDPHPLFNTRVLHESLGESVDKNRTPLETYLERHRDPGVRVSNYFDISYYRSQLRAFSKGIWDAGGEPELLGYYLQQGWKMPCNPHRAFDQSLVTSQLGAANKAPLLVYAMAENVRDIRTHAAFDPALGKTHGAFETSRQLDSINRYTRISRESRPPVSKAFDSEFYKERYPDISNLCPNNHFLLYGYSESRVPNRFFSESYIRNKYRGESFARRGAVQYYFEERLADVPAIFVVAGNAHRSPASEQLLVMLEGMLHKYASNVYLLLDGGGDLLESFASLAHVHVLNECGDTGFKKTQKHGEALTAEMVSLSRFVRSMTSLPVVCSGVGVRHVGNLLRTNGVKTISLVHNDDKNHSAHLWSQVMGSSDAAVFGSEYVMRSVRAKLARTRMPEHVLVPGLPSTELRRLGSLHAERLRRSADLSNLIVMSSGGQSVADGFDLFLGVVSRYNARTESGTNGRQMTFIWIDTDGDRPASNDFFRLDHRLMENITIVPASRAELMQHVGSADAYIPCARNSQDAELILRVAGQGCPIVYFRDCGVAEEILGRRAGIGVGYGDGAAILKGLERLADDDSERAKYQAVSRNLVEVRHSEDAYIKGLMRVLYSGQGTLPEPMVTDRKRAIYFLSNDWMVSGVNTFTENLVKNLVIRGYNAKILFTRGKDGSYPDRALMPQVPHEFLQPSGKKKWFENIWTSLSEFLADHESAIVVPNYDYIASSIAPICPSNVGFLGIAHSDDVEHYEHVYRLGRWWNRIVAVSSFIQDQICEQNRSFSDKTGVIRYGVPVSGRSALTSIRGKSELRDGVIRLVYTGRMIHQQKRVERYIELVKHLEDLQVDYELCLLGDGPELTGLRSTFAGNPRVRLPGRVQRDEIVDVLRAANVFLLLSDYEGLPLSLLEAMTEGCVPVVSDISSGVHEIISDGDNGFICDRHDLRSVASRIKEMTDDTDLMTALAEKSYRSVVDHKLTEADMTDEYIHLFEEIFEEIESARYVRPQTFSSRASKIGAIPPPWLA